MTRQPHEDAGKTAADAYRARGVEIETQMEALAEALERHHAEHSARPTDWGYVGDLGHVRDLLANALAFLQGR